MKVTPTALPEVLLIEPRVFPDARGHFYESWVGPRYQEAGIDAPFVQDNFSRSTRNTLRGLHFQEPKGQGKLITVLSGKIYDVAVDVRIDSPRYRDWIGIELDGDNPQQLWIPPGFAHGFCVLSAQADFMYKCTEFYAPETERSIHWDDPELAIDWPLDTPILSEKDAAAPFLADAPVLPRMSA
ncbi:MAG: dTDP-4-dehydrorhamnose 3,5-epimerase [Alphaproteobacteria bacterium]